MNKSIVRYWGKADPSYPGEPKWHPLAYHCLDVAAVAAVWWDGSPPIRQAFLSAFRSTEPAQLRAWALFFVALHDLGKFDARFQLKAPGAVREAWSDLDPRDVDGSLVRGFDHGRVGYACALYELKGCARDRADLETAREAWRPWLAAATGHHGDLPSSLDTGGEYAEVHVMDHDRDARRTWTGSLTTLFLSPVGLDLASLPPVCEAAAQAFFAGYCAVCDWVGSNAETFPYAHLDEYPSLADYSEARVDRFIREGGLGHFGLSARAKGYAGVQALLKSDERPRGVQTLVDTLPATPGLTLIEAPTGSGKTEAALACAWRLLAVGQADWLMYPQSATYGR
jgi:CRISPR-associated endonuclease/helicase Cas3